MFIYQTMRCFVKRPIYVPAMVLLTAGAVLPPSDVRSNDGLQYEEGCAPSPHSSFHHVRYILLMYYMLPLTYSTGKRKVGLNRDQLTPFSAPLGSSRSSEI